MTEQIKQPENKEIDWKSLIPPKFLYVNNDPKRREKLEKKYGKPYDQLDPVVDKIDDTDLVIMLGGLKHLLKLRGYKSVKYQIKESNLEYASVCCSIVFTPNKEVNHEVEYSDCACAHYNNTTNFAQHYLVEMATNRALCRTIRSYLNLNIVSKEELDANTDSSEQVVESAPLKQIKILQELMDKKHVKFDPHIIKKLKDANQYKEEYTSIDKLPKEVIFDLLERLKKYNPS